MVENRFFICERCGNLIGMIKESGAQVVCCGQPMTKLEAGAVEASAEKHIPAVRVEGEKVFVEVGSLHHPMIPEHSIEWVYLQTDRGGHRKKLSPGDDPCVEFALASERPVAVFAYCNLHGLWVKEI